MENPGNSNSGKPLTPGVGRGREKELVLDPRKSHSRRDTAPE